MNFRITGMTCAACAAHVEKAVKALPDVSTVNVNLLTNSMSVEGSASEKVIISAVSAAGYGAAREDGRAYSDDTLRDEQTPRLKRRLIASVCVLLPLMYVTMGGLMWSWWMPSFMHNGIVAGVYQLVLTMAVIIINRNFFISGTKSLLHGSPNMDTLVSLGAGVSFIYSCFVLFQVISATLAGDSEAVHIFLHGLYFESAAMILTLVTVGKTLEARSKGKTTDALKGLVKLAPKLATVLRDGEQIIIPAEQLVVGDIFTVKPGESVPADGTVLEGSSSVNEASLTGESIPVDKSPGCEVSAATINTSGFLKCRAVRVGSDTALARIIRLVSDAASSKAPIARIADKVSAVFVPAVLGIAVITAAVWIVAGYDIGFALTKAVCVLVISCPCALGLATPVAIMVGSGTGAKHGILFKTASALEGAAKTETVVLDKTGTVTNGKPAVTDIFTAEGVGEDELLEAAVSLESLSEHPLAGAVAAFASERCVFPKHVDEFQAVSGNGLTGKIGALAAVGGKRDFVSQFCLIPDFLLQKADEASLYGKTPLYFSLGGRVLGMIAVADEIKPDSASAVSELKGMGIGVIMLTGDNRRTAEAVARQAGITEIFSDVLPEGKENVIRESAKSKPTAMVGDGINDAPALTRADIGIAIGTGTDVAADAADIVLVNSRLRDVPAAIRLSRRVLANIRQNLFWAFFYNVICIPLAAGVWYPAFGLELSPMFGALAMSLSSFCVVLNALRLNFTDIYNSKHDRKLIHKRRNKTMKKTLHITGMMCGHCEAAVKKALEAVSGVESADVSHVSGTAVVTMSAPISDEALRKTVTALDYTVTSID